MSKFTESATELNVVLCQCAIVRQILLKEIIHSITAILFPDVYIVYGHTTCIYIIQTNNSKHTQLICFSM